jgi:hypothetical protein
VADKPSEQAASLERYSSPSPSHNANPDPKLGKKIEKEKGA